MDMAEGQLGSNILTWLDDIYRAGLAPEPPLTVSQWADLQQSLGVAGWASMKKQVDAFMQQPPDEREEKPPPGSSGNSMPGRQFIVGMQVKF